MKAAYYEEFNGPIRIEQLPDPEPGSAGVVIKVEASGLCLSDWHGWRGHDPDIQLPHVPGHELSGTIVATGKEIRKFKIGDRVTVPFVGGCGKCEYCKSGDQQVCDNQFQPGFTAWGSFAEYVSIDYADENLVRLPESLSSVDAASLGCRFITAYRAVRHQARLQAEQFIAVYGCGGVGLSAIQIGKALGARVIAVDISDSKCDYAQKLGADYAINSSKTPVVEAIRDISKGGVHVSLDALGHTETCINSIRSLRKRGRHIQVGLMTDQHARVGISMPEIIANELEIIGSHGMQAHKYPEMFEFLKKSGINLALMRSDTASLDLVPELLPKLMSRKTPGITVIDAFSG